MLSTILSVMKFANLIIPCLLAFIATISPTVAYALPTEKGTSPANANNNLPAWLIELSNKPEEIRREYLETFNTAKLEYIAGNWVRCYSLLSQCEFIVSGNPNAYNLMVSCLIEQGNFSEAKALLQKVQKELPTDQVTIINVANLHMAQKEYQACINVIQDIIKTLPHDASQSLLDVLTYRIFLCHLMLKQEQEAKQLVKHLNPLSDTPLYYFSQIALHLQKGNKSAAKADLQAVYAIFQQAAALPYVRCLNLIGQKNLHNSHTP